MARRTNGSYAGIFNLPPGWLSVCRTFHFQFAEDWSFNLPTPPRARAPVGERQPAQPRLQVGHRGPGSGVPATSVGPTCTVVLVQISSVPMSPPPQPALPPTSPPAPTPRPS